MTEVILVPRRADNGYRDSLWDWTKAWWEREQSHMPIFEGHHETGLFNRSAAVNRAAALAGDWDIVLVGNPPVPPLGAVLYEANLALGLRIVDMGDPVDPQDAATKAYVDAAPFDAAGAAAAAQAASQPLDADLTTFAGSSPETYTETNVATDRAFDAGSMTLNEMANVLGSLIVDLRTRGVVA